MALRQLRHEHILFKISLPAESHAQTAVECALQLHPVVKDRIGDIEHIELRTQESAIRIISKDGHCTIRPTATTACSTWWRRR